MNKGFKVARYDPSQNRVVPITKKAMEDQRPFFVRLVSSIRFSGKVKKSGVQVNVSGGTDF
jgi:hypothetical protein